MIELYLVRGGYTEMGRQVARQKRVSAGQESIDCRLPIADFQLIGAEYQSAMGNRQ
jgi:hypothetical protein